MSKTRSDTTFRILKCLAILGGVLSGFICMIVIGALIHIHPTGWTTKTAVQVVGFTSFGFVAGWASIRFLGWALVRRLRRNRSEMSKHSEEARAPKANAT